MQAHSSSDSPLPHNVSDTLTIAAEQIVSGTLDLAGPGAECKPDSRSQKPDKLANPTSRSALHPQELSRSTNINAAKSEGGQREVLVNKHVTGSKSQSTPPRKKVGVKSVQFDQVCL